MFSMVYDIDNLLGIPARLHEFEPGRPMNKYVRHILNRPIYSKGEPLTSINNHLNMFSREVRGEEMEVTVSLFYSF